MGKYLPAPAVHGFLACVGCKDPASGLLLSHQTKVLKATEGSDGHSLKTPASASETWGYLITLFTTTTQNAGLQPSVVVHVCNPST